MMIVEQQTGSKITVARASHASVAACSTPDEKTVLVQLIDQHGEVFAVAPFTLDGAILFAAKMEAMANVLMGRVLQ